MDIDLAVQHFRQNHRSVLATRRRDGRPQLSPVVHAVGIDGRILISTRSAAMKARNIGRDPRVSICALSDAFFGKWAQVDGTAAIVDAFTKDFPKIQGSYVRAQTGALYSKVLAERSAGRYDVDVIQLSDLAPAIDFQKKGGYEIYQSPEAHAYQAKYLSDPPGAYFWTGVDFTGICYCKSRVPDADAPKNWKDLLDPRWRGAMSCKIASSGLQFVQWYELRKLYGDSYWTSFAKQLPHAFDSRVQLMDRLARGDDKVTAVGEYAAYVL